MVWEVGPPEAPPTRFHALGEGTRDGGLIPSSPHGQHRSRKPPPRTPSIYLADMCGATARNGEVCYGPNRGYGRFGAKVTMDCKRRRYRPVGNEECTRGREDATFLSWAA